MPGHVFQIFSSVYPRIDARISLSRDIMTIKRDPSFHTALGMKASGRFGTFRNQVSVKISEITRMLVIKHCVGLAPLSSQTDSRAKVVFSLQTIQKRLFKIVPILKVKLNKKYYDWIIFYYDQMQNELKIYNLLKGFEIIKSKIFLTSG